MKKTLIYSFFLIVLSIHSQTPTLQWAKKLGDISKNDKGISVSTDQTGNVYSTGCFYGTIDADPSSSVYNLFTSGGWDTYISKLDNNGNFVWAKKIGGVNDDVPTEITTDQSGNSYISGSFSGIVDFDPSSVNTFTLNGVANGENFILKLDANGNFVWVKQFTSTDADFINSITLDATGDLLLAGRLYGIMDFDPSTSSTYTLSNTSVCSFICKITNSGNFVWAKKYGFTLFTGGNGLAHSVKTDSNNNIYTSGYFYGTADFDPSPGAYTLTANGNTQDAYIAKFDANGNLKWANNYGSIYFDDALSSTIDSKGNVYTTGHFGGTADFNPSASATFTIANFNNSNDVYITKVDSLGNFIWAKQIGGNFEDLSNFITSDNSDNIYVCGGFEYICDFNPSTTTTYSLTSNGAKDGFVTKLDENGNFIWNATFGAISGDFASCVKTDNLGSILITGYYERTVDFDPTSSTFNLSGNTGNSDAFVWKLNSVSTDINELLNKNIGVSFKAYPNPANNYITIIPSGNFKNNYTILVCNSLGEVVQSNHVQQGKATINLSDLSSGLYHISIKDDQNISTQKIIIE